MNDSDTLSDRAHEILDNAAEELRTIGMDSAAAAWRAMAWNAFTGIIAAQSPAAASADLQRLRDMLDKHLDELSADA